MKKMALSLCPQNPLVGSGTLPFHSFNGSSVSSNGFWSKHRNDVRYNQLQKQDAAGGRYSARATDNQSDGDLCMANERQDDAQDPSVHPWGGLTAARDGTLTLLDCYLYSKSLKGLQTVFDSACAREREREHELLYPDACGGGG